LNLDSKIGEPHRRLERSSPLGEKVEKDDGERRRADGQQGHELEGLDPATRPVIGRVLLQPRPAASKERKREGGMGSGDGGA
jgi:hypothetical protein